MKKSIDVFTVIGKNGFPLSKLLLESMKSLSSSDTEINYNAIMSARRAPPGGWNWIESVIKQKHTSLNHTTGLNRVYDYIKSDYTIITDADIAMLSNDWDTVLIKEIEDRNVDILGVDHWTNDNLGTFPLVTFFIARSASLLDARPDFRPNLVNYPNKWGFGANNERLSAENAKILGCRPGSLFGMDSGWEIPFAFLKKGYKGDTFEKISNIKVPHIPEVWRVANEPILSHLGKSTKRRRGRIAQYIKSVHNILNTKNQESETDNKICGMRGCCACCMGGSVPPHSKEEFVNLPQDEQQWIAKYEMDHGKSGPCMWLNTQTRLCSNYENRPEICKKFVINGHTCKILINESRFK